MINRDYVAITQNCRNKIVWKRYLVLFFQKKKIENYSIIALYDIQTIIRNLYYGLYHSMFITFFYFNRIYSLIGKNPFLSIR